MNSAPAHTLTLAILSLSAAAPQAFADCSPRVLRNETLFPERAELRGQEGTVLLDVVIDEQGAPAEVYVVDSSGYRLLDGAAEKSVRATWQFDVSGCERKDLPITQRIAVEYRNDEY